MGTTDQMGGRKLAMIKALVINLDAAKERLEFQERQLSELQIPWRRVQAINAEEVDESLPFWSTWERPLRKTEIACLTSHQKTWEEVATGKDPVLILEDDVILHKTTTDFLTQVETICDPAKIDHITLEVRGRKKFLHREGFSTPSIRKMHQDRTGAAAYVLFPSGATKLINETKQRCGLADAVIANFQNLKSWQAWPGLAMQSDQCKNYGFDPPINPSSWIDAHHKSHTKTMPQRIRRLRFQLRLAVAHLRTDVVKTNVPPAPGPWSDSK